MEQKNLNKTPEKTDERPQNGYNTIAAVHSKFSSLVSSKTVYSLRYSPKVGHSNK